MIDGREYMLAGRVSDRGIAMDQRDELLKRWTLVRIIRLSDWDFMLYVHGAR
jgi:hypothetical protein